MSYIFEENKQPVTTIEEVKKLQELVRKLELQNLHLRNKQVSSIQRSSGVKLSNVPKIPKNSNANVLFANQDEYFDELEIIKVSDIEMSDDESWLYSSPSKSSSEKSGNSYNWLRKDIDDPESKPLQLAKTALLNKLSELEVPRHSDCISIDSRTFTKSRRKQAFNILAKLDSSDFIRKVEKIKSDESFSGECEVFAESDMISLPISHVLEDANDVHEVARLQEASLRMISPKCSFKLESVDTTPSENDSGLIDPLQHSNHSSSSESPYSSNISLHDSEEKNVKLCGYRRSLPNLNHESAEAVQSRNKLMKEATSASSNLCKVQCVKRNAESLPESFCKNQRQYVPTSVAKCPTKRGLNQRRDGSLSLPKSQPLSNVPYSDDCTVVTQSKSTFSQSSKYSVTPRSVPRSGIPMPSLLPKKRLDDSWSDGCY